MVDSDTAVVSILETIATAERTDSVQLPPLSDAVDPESLNALLDADASAPFRVTFDYAGYEVTVDRDGGVTAIPAAAPGVGRATDGGVARPVSTRADEELAE